MDKEIVKQWDKYRDNFKDYLSTHNISEFDEYTKLFALILKIILKDMNFSDKFVVIDDGEYQGTQLFICHLNTYQPSMYEYYITDNYYGSCSCCDTMLGILERKYEGIPTEVQVKELMQLALNLIQGMKCLDDSKT